MDSSKGLPAVSLLNSYMNIILSASRKQIITLTCISKGVERVEVLDSGQTMRFLFLGGNGLRKAAAGEGGQGGRSVGKRGGSRGRLLSPRRRLSDWGGGAAPVFTYIAAPVTPARCPHVQAPPTALCPLRPAAAASNWPSGGDAGRRLRRNCVLREGVLSSRGEMEGGGKGWSV